MPAKLKVVTTDANTTLSKNNWRIIRLPRVYAHTEDLLLLTLRLEVKSVKLG